LTQRTLPLGESETFGYDEDGNVVSHTDFNGTTTARRYDELDRVTHDSGPEGTTDYSYTDEGLLAAVQDKSGTTRYAHDRQGRLARTDRPDGSAIEYGYDIAGNETSLTTAAGTVAYSYDDTGRLVGVTDPEGGETHYDYDAVGNRTSSSLPDGTQTSASYDARDRLKQIDHLRDDGSVLASYRYTFASTGQRTGVLEGGRSAAYRYDALGRLIEERVTDAGAGDVTTGYGYDAVGNRLSSVSGPTTTEYSYDADDRMLTAGTTAFDYDDNGNLIRRTEGSDVRALAYDSANRLVSSNGGPGAVEYQYDAAGNRVGVRSGAKMTRYLVDENAPLTRVLEERSNDGSPAAQYVHGSELISQRRGGSASFYHQDALGSTRLLTNATGAVTDAYAYDAFGGIAAISGDTQNDFRFRAEQFEPETGTYNLRARHYDPGTGRFVSRDPLLVTEPEQPLAVHKYLYAGNDPINTIDPTGTTGIGETAIATSESVSASAAEAFSAFNAGRTVISGINRLKGAIQSVTAAANQGLRKLTRAAWRLLRQFNVFFTGLVDTPETTLHIAEAITEKHSSVFLHKSDGQGSRHWYNGKEECRGRAAERLRRGMKMACDEYPFFSTREGGSAQYDFGRVSLQLVPSWEQSIQGARLGFKPSSGRVATRGFYKKCGLSSPDYKKSEFLVIPGLMPVTFGMCKRKQP
jgi:RHS repeat-associated protein